MTKIYTLKMHHKINIFSNMSCIFWLDRLTNLECLDGQRNSHTVASPFQETSDKDGKCGCKDCSVIKVIFCLLLGLITQKNKIICAVFPHKVSNQVSSVRVNKLYWKPCFASLGENLYIFHSASLMKCCKTHKPSTLLPYE